MAGFTGTDDMISEITAGGKIMSRWFNIRPPGAVGTGMWWSAWYAGVRQGNVGASPATTPGTVYDSDDASAVSGSIWFPDTSTDNKYLTVFEGVSSAAGVLMLYDRLAGVSGIGISGTGTKTVNSGSLTRYSGTDAINNQVWLEWSTAGTAVQLQANLNSYTSADGSTGLTGGNTQASVAAPPIGGMMPLSVDGSKRGVRSVEAGINVGTANTSGIANCLIIRPLAYLPLSANQWNTWSFVHTNPILPRIYDNATLCLAYLGGGTPIIHGRITVAYG